MNEFSTEQAKSMAQRVEEGQIVWQTCSALHEIYRALDSEPAWRALSPLDGRWWVSMAHGEHLVEGASRKGLDGWMIQTSLLGAHDLPPSLLFTWYWPQAQAFVRAVKNHKSKEDMTAAMFDSVFPVRFMEAPEDHKAGMRRVVEMLVVVVHALSSPSTIHDS